MNTLLQKYQHNVINKPIKTFALQSSFMMTLGDIVSQQVIEKKGLKNHDISRSLRMTVYGATIGGPVIGTWFGFINRVITIQNKWKAMFVRVAIDQMFFSPAILACFMTGISLLEGRSIDEIKKKFQTSYFNGLKNSYCYWPFVNAFTFSFVPMYYRPIVNSGFGLVWNSYLSHLNQKTVRALQQADTAITAEAPPSTSVVTAL